MIICKKLFCVLIFLGWILCSSGQSDVDREITKVYLVFKTHLDIGFTELSSKVVDVYNGEFIPAALRLSEELSQTLESDTVSYPWTTGS